MADSIRAVLFVCAAATLAAMAGVGDDGARFGSLKTPAPVGGPGPLPGLEGYECARCHEEVAAEWSRTMHAHSWIDEHYQRDLEGRRKPQGCHGCHAPEPLHAKLPLEKPEPRGGDRKLGISCEACHQAGDGAQLGPTGAPTDAHATRASDTMVGAGSNALCIACHSTTVGPVIGIAKDFAASGPGKRGLTCVGCHFAPLREVGEGEAKRVVRSHELQTPRDPAFLRLAFEPTAKAERDGALVEVRNMAGHRIPGLIGREIEFELAALDASGKVLAREVQTLTTSAYLPVDGALELRVAAKGAKLRLRGIHRDPRGDEEVPFLEEELAWP